MKESSVQVNYKNSPVLLDKVIQDLRKSLLDKLSWLDFAFGRAYKLVEHRLDGNKFVYPAVYNGNAEYLSMLPNDNLGNFSWFDIYDPQDVIPVIQGQPQFTFRGAIVFWYNQDSIFADQDFLRTEEIKNEIISVLTSPGIISGAGRLEIVKIYESFENIYKGYSLEKIYNNFNYAGEDIQSIDKQFFMYPFAGIRIEFNITTRELCQRYIK